MTASRLTSASHCKTAHTAHPAPTEQKIKSTAFKVWSLVKRNRKSVM
ncbi:hypothetical protein EGR_10170 [Echinococcus granulosus]|uniref:Uncharacterized protein n=1 Tax=Echinococcus granulosus TaxID=6210 RepID=W6U8Z2_ECHGR|nr:hypothetical protein EGR_10170 [Echinococcus granulosus]EUB54962.1 hypothetical protein EGR_10170 [Echinococcus granulosus]